MQQHHSATRAAPATPATPATGQGSGLHTINALAEDGMPATSSKGKDFIPSLLYAMSAGPASSTLTFNVTPLHFKITKSTISCREAGESVSKLSNTEIASSGKIFKTKS